MLVNNAGVAKAFAANPLALDPDDADEMLAVNLAAPMRLVALLAPGLAKNGNGVIINVSSVAGIDPKPHAIGYASSKWGMTGCARRQSLRFFVCRVMGCDWAESVPFVPQGAGSSH